MSKIEILKKSIRAGGMNGLTKIIHSYVDTHFRKEVKSKWPIKSLVNSDMAQYGIMYGYYFDIYNPHSFTEKIHTYKLLYEDPRMSEIVDKYTFKGYVQKILGSSKYVAKPYGVYNSVEQLKKAWHELPNEFVLKSTISGDGNNIIFIEDKNSVDFQSLVEDLQNCLNPRNTLLNGYAKAYRTLQPRILAEEFMKELDGSGLIDYKFYCFDGNVEFVYTTSRVFESKDNPSDSDYPRTFFDPNWKKIDVALGNHPTANGIKKPRHFEEMLEIAKKVSSGFPFVRVDFYDTKDYPLLGEMTFYPTGGWKTLSPIEFDRKLGEKFIIPADKLIKI